MTLSIVAPPVTTVTIGGVVYTQSVLRVADYSEAAKVLSSKRPGPFDVIKDNLAKLEPDQQRMLLEIAYRDSRNADLFAIDEVRGWFTTPEGRVWRFWKTVVKSHPEITIDQAELLVIQADKEDAEERNRQAAEAARKRAEAELEGMPPGNPTRPAMAPVAKTPDANQSPIPPASPG